MECFIGESWESPILHKSSLFMMTQLFQTIPIILSQFRLAHFLHLISCLPTFFSLIIYSLSKAMVSRSMSRTEIPQNWLAWGHRTGQVALFVIGTWVWMMSQGKGNKRCNNLALNAGYPYHCTSCALLARFRISQDPWSVLELFRYKT